MKFLGKLLLILIILLVAVGAIGWFYMNDLAKQGIEKGGTYALMVDTTVDEVSIKPLRGEMSLSKLKIANPQGFKTPFLIETGQFSMAVDTGTLMADTVVVKDFDLNGLELYIEQTLQGSNIQAIMKNLERFAAKKGPDDQPDQQPEPEGPGKKVKVDRLVVRNVVAHLNLLGQNLDIKVDEMTFPELTQENAAGVTVPVLISRLVPAIFQAVIDKAQVEGVLPADFAAQLESSINSAVTRLGEDARKAVSEATASMGAEIEKATEGLGRQMEEGLGGLLNTGEGTDASGGDDQDTEGEKEDEGLGGALRGIFGGDGDDEQ